MSVADRNQMKIGSRAPDFDKLPAVDGSTYALADFSSAKVLVVVFSCNHCPYVQAYEDRLMDVQREFEADGMRLVAINANDASTYPDDSFDRMVRRSKEKNFNFVYLRDETQEVARAYGATHTPHLYVFDRNRRLAYTGRIDDNWQDPARVTKRYLRDAVVALLNDREPPVRETFAIGCTIKWKI